MLPSQQMPFSANDAQDHRQIANHSSHLVYIASDVRSGSTLLDLILGSHPDIISVGEIQFLTDHFRRTGVGYSWDWKCTCDKSFAACPFWDKINITFEKQTGSRIQSKETWVRRTSQPFPMIFLSNRWMSNHITKYPSIRRGLDAAETCWKIIDILHEITGKRLIVDSSKNAEQLRYLYYLRPSAIRLIYLIRDGRAVVYSKMTREQDSCRKASKNWIFENLKILAFRTRLPKTQSIVIKYESLCEYPQREVARICQFLQIPFTTINLSKSDRHNVGGSPHRFDWNNTEIKLDERWKAQMSERDRKSFFIIAGWLNYLLGYK